MAPLTPDDGELITDVRRELEQFVEFLTATGGDSLQSKIPDRKDLQRAVDRLGDCASAVIHAIEQSESGEAREQALRSLWAALGWAFVIGSDGTLSDNSKVVAAQVRAMEMRGKRGRQLQQDPTTRILSEVVDKLRCPGDEAHPYKWAKAMLDDVNRALEVNGLDRVSHYRIGRYIKDHPVRS